MTRQFNFPSSITNACICTVGTQIIRIASKLYMNYLGYPYEIALKRFAYAERERINKSRVFSMPSDYRLWTLSRSGRIVQKPRFHVVACSGEK